MNEQLIAPCGMNCRLCISYQAMHYDLNKEGFKKKYCPGCIPRGKNCTFMAGHCTKLSRGEVRFCFACEQFPCKRLKALDKRYRDNYQMSMIDNLRAIQTRGMQAFLDEQEQSWSCPTCQEIRCCHNGLCLKCDMDRLKSNKRYRRNRPATKE